ncbi:MAG: N-acyl-D-amino-acid deacylase family protein [Bacillota bacterium]|jgi:N-acyl-D-amino-acid deacylase
MYDLIIRHARIVDGTGSPWFVGDLAVQDGRIAAMGPKVSGPTKQEIDGTGLTLTPGFIDVHSHSDFTLPIDGGAESRLLQGVTTEIGGNCGLSPAPVLPERLALLQKYSAFLAQGLPWNWTSFGEFLQAVEDRQPAVNFGGLVGHGTLRVAVMGFDRRPPEENELQQMQRLLAQSMEEGAFGLSSGLIYPPGCYADTAELAAVASAIAPYGGIYETHMRNEGDDILQSIDESAAIGQQAGVAVQVAHHKVVGRHNWGRAGDSQGRIAAWRAKGLDIANDQYPYTASSTTITTIFPDWAHEGGVDGLLQRLTTPETRERLRQEVTEKMAKQSRRFADILIASVNRPENKHLEGKTVAEAAEAAGRDPLEFCFDLVAAEDAGVASVVFGMDEADVKTIMAHPLTMIGSDGASMPIQGPGKPHPRNFSTFVRVLAKYSLEEQVVPLEEAVRKMTALPASRMRLFDRGLLRPGCWADLVLFDAAELAETATYADPRRAPVGIKQVYVNGQLAVQDGQVTGARAGQILRHQ